MVVEKLSSAVYTPLDDGTGVLLNVETLVYFSLNRTAATVWQKIEAQKSPSFDDLTATLCQKFDVSANTARQEIDSFVRRLEQLGVVHLL
jgi:coenzyme PQQ synthesis protein D (PqqD)